MWNESGENKQSVLIEKIKEVFNGEFLLTKDSVIEYGAVMKEVKP